LREMAPERLSVIDQALTDLLSILDAAEDAATELPEGGKNQHKRGSVPSAVSESERI
jgi:hypothetical protein